MYEGRSICFAPRPFSHAASMWDFVNKYKQHLGLMVPSFNGIRPPDLKLQCSEWKPAIFWSKIRRCQTVRKDKFEQIECIDDYRKSRPLCIQTWIPVPLSVGDFLVKYGSADSSIFRWICGCKTTGVNETDKLSTSFRSRMADVDAHKNVSSKLFSLLS